MDTPQLRALLDALANHQDLNEIGNVLGVYLELVDEPTFTPEKALYAGLVEMGIMTDPDVELAVIADEPIRLNDPLLDILDAPHQKGDQR